MGRNVITDYLKPVAPMCYHIRQLQDGSKFFTRVVMKQRIYPRFISDHWIDIVDEQPKNYSLK